MRLFADTSDPDLIRRLYEQGIIQGVTTNPTSASEYLKKAGGSMRGLAFEIADRVGPIPISIEAVGCGPPDYKPEEITADRLYEEGAEVIEWNKQPDVQFWQKMPTIPQGLEATYRLVKDFGERAKINSTLGFDYRQAMRAAEVGAYVFSLFMGRMQQNGEDAVAVARRIIDEYIRRDLRIGFLAASMRTPELIIASWEAGADIATASSDVLKQLVDRYPKKFEEMRSHPETRTITSNVLPNSYDPDEFKHPLLEPGVKRFVSDGKSVGYNLLEVKV